ncbi:hypothetical protein [Chryseobacterium sp. WLY505]|uniref:hypothetical protein n=1 Tax=Chryseobacterium sp. WLY505 TaxID=3068892 RepID=UPI002796C007|nr:hypothetical protein [Chryseobacterium sp. WLY505]MDQ1859281.1 hypothetical protein [Chryseobacterium sp. WLY505]
MKLKSMTEFVLQQNKNLKLAEEIIPQYKSIVKYAEFLKQPLTLGMFVPTDEEGNIIDKQPCFTFANPEYKNKTECIKYWQAKEKVLFEGFSIRKERNKKYVGTPGYEIELPLNNMTIEDLANDWDVEMTPSALKQIGL